MLSDKEEICVVQPEKDFGSTQIFLPNDGVSLADCATLGPKYVAKQSTPNGCAPHPCYRDCATFNSSFTSYVCQTCVPSPISSTTTLPSTTSATTTWSTTASSMPSREWEEFAGPFNRVCRGLGPTDNNPAYFTVHFEVASVEACKDLCLEQGEEGCKGVEYNSISKRCEVWTRREGIWAFDYPQWEGFTCLRYGWPGKYLIPVNGGLDQACRGPDGKNSDSYYVVERFVSHMEDCRARCVAAKICKGVEFSKGRCEIWTTDIVTTKAIAGFECLRYQPPEQVQFPHAYDYLTLPPAPSDAGAFSMATTAPFTTPAAPAAPAAGGNDLNEATLSKLADDMQQAMEDFGKDNGDPEKFASLFDVVSRYAERQQNIKAGRGGGAASPSTGSRVSEEAAHDRIKELEAQAAALTTR
eukprot:Skav234792  [mRNA]  locus=scaffold69:127365:137294:+ [translate_table: standard]